MASKKHEITSKPAPIGGLNARDGISIMPEGDAVNLVNWVADTFGLRTRKGFREWAVGFPGDPTISSIFSHIAANSAPPDSVFLTVPVTVPGEMFAATDEDLYDITDTTNAPVSVHSLSGTPGAGWLHTTRISNIAGAFTLICSEVDGYFYYNGTTFTAPTMGAGAGQIANVDPADLVFCMTWKRRAWFVERDSTSAWYLPIDSITGAAVEFDFGAIFKNGGSLSYLANWTLDAGEGIDDFLVVVSSLGDVAVYKGTDPANSATFGLVGTWSIGQIPVGRRAFAQYGGDLVILSADGITPVSLITRGGSTLLVASGSEYSTKIRSPLARDMRYSFTSLGWQLFLHPTERLFIANVPDQASEVDKQYAMSTTLNSWSVFSGIPAYCYGMNTGYAFAGTRDGRVLLLFDGFLDNVEYGQTAGDPINGVVQPAFGYFNSPAETKHFHMARVSFLAYGPPTLTVDMNVNFSVKTPVGVASFAEDNRSRWDVDYWGSATWGGSLQTYAEWAGVSGVGFSGAANIRTQISVDTTLTSIDYMYSVGGPL